MLRTGVSGWTGLKNSDFSVGYLRFGNLSLNNQKAVIEVKFEKNVQDENSSMEIIYHERVVSNEDVAKILQHLANNSIVNKARKLMQLLNDSNVCKGNHLPEDDLNRYERGGGGGGAIRRHLVSDVNGFSEQRVFAVECQVHTNSAMK